jgi:hypothetical protein
MKQVTFYSTDYRVKWRGTTEMGVGDRLVRVHHILLPSGVSI